MQEGPCEKLPSIDEYLDALLNRYDGNGQAQSTTSSFDFNTAGRQQEYYWDLIQNGAPEPTRSDKFQEVIWHLASCGWTVEQIVDELAKYPNGIGLKYAGRLLKEVGRSYGKWQSQRRAGAVGSSVGATGAGVTPWPQIKVIPGELPRVVEEAEAALMLLDREIYQRGGVLVRPVLNRMLKSNDGGNTESWQLIELTRQYLIRELCCAAQFQRYDGRSKKFVPIDAPYKVAENYLNLRGRWKLPRLVGVVNAPFLRAARFAAAAAGPAGELTFEVGFSR